MNVQQQSGNVPQKLEVPQTEITTTTSFFCESQREQQPTGQAGINSQQVSQINMATFTLSTYKHVI